MHLLSTQIYYYFSQISPKFIIVSVKFILSLWVGNHLKINFIRKLGTMFILKKTFLPSRKPGYITRRTAVLPVVRCGRAPSVSNAHPGGGADASPSLLSTQ